MSNRKKFLQNWPDLSFRIVVTVITVSAFLFVLYPIYFVVIASFSDSTLVNQGQVILYPKGVSLYGYSQIFKKPEIWVGYKNTIIYSFFGTIFNLTVTLPAAYVLSRKDFPWRNKFAFFFFFTTATEK